MKRNHLNPARFFLYLSIALGFTLALAPTNNAFATPITIHMDAYLLGILNIPVTGITMFQFKLYNTQVDGPSIYTESTMLGVQNGNFSHDLGSTKPLDNSLFSSTRWPDTSLFGIFSLSPRVRITNAHDTPNGISSNGLYKVFYGSAIPHRVSAVPEPSTTLLLGIALAAVFGYCSWRKLAV